ncbi:hypothetical protein [Rahnella sp. EDr1-12]|uniref:hypothetical protein n=1 Tax=unclassified Rahnella TaxID=2635087 RepID=UPI003BA9ED93
MTLQTIKDILLVFSFIISIATLIVHFRNSKLQKLSYLMNRNNSRVGETNFEFVECKQVGDEYILKLVLFNPSSVATVVKSLTVTKTVEHPNFIMCKLGFMKKVKVQFRWSPAVDSHNFIVTLYKESYELLYVKDVAVFFVAISGHVNRDLHHIELRTNHDFQTVTTRIDGFNARFPIHFEQWFNG